jgi:hypothetical protein
MQLDSLLINFRRPSRPLFVCPNRLSNRRGIERKYFEDTRKCEGVINH